MNQELLIQLLHGAIHQDASIRNDALIQLDLYFIDIIQIEQLLNVYLLNSEYKLLVSIYLKYWINKNHQTLDTQVISALLNRLIQMNNSQLNHQLEDAIILILKDQYMNLQVLEFFKQILNFQLKYKIMKSFYKEHGTNRYVEQLCQSLYHDNTNYTKEQQLKLMIFHCKILPQIQPLGNYLTELQNLMKADQVEKRIIYLYQKFIINTLEFQNKHTNQELSQLLTLFSQFYFNNPMLQHTYLINNNITLDHIELNRTNENNKLVLQVVKILKLIAQHYTNNPMNELYLKNQQMEEFEVILYETYFNDILSFLLRYTLILSPQQLYDIQFNQENAYSESNESSYDIREYAVDFISLAIQSMKQEEVCQKINKCCSSFSPLSDFKSIIHKEALYYIIRNFMHEMEFNIEDYIDQFIEELNIQDPQFDPLKIQIMFILLKFLTNNDEVEQQTLNKIMQTIISLQTTNICLILLQVDVMIQLIQFIEPTLLQNLWINAKTLYPKLQQEQSKVCIFNLYSQFVKHNLVFDDVWVLELFHQEWMKGQLTIQEKIIDVAIDILQRQDNISKYIDNFYIPLIQGSFQIDEPLLIDNALKLLLTLQSRCYEQKIEINLILIQQYIVTKLVDQIEYWNQVLMFQIYLLHSKNVNEKLFISTILKMVEKHNEIKEEPYLKLYKLIELIIAKDVNVGKQLIQDIMTHFQLQQISNRVVLKLNYLCNITQLFISDQFIEKCFAIYLEQDQINKQEFETFLNLIRDKNLQYYQKGIEKLNSAQPILDPDENGFRDLFKGTRLRIPM